MAGTVQVEDTGSTNGTFVNEEHIGFNGKRDLRDGDKVRFGGFSTRSSSKIVIGRAREPPRIGARADRRAATPFHEYRELT